MLLCITLSSSVYQDKEFIIEGGLGMDQVIASLPPLDTVVAEGVREKP